MKLKTVDELKTMCDRVGQECKRVTGQDKVWGDSEIPAFIQAKGKVLYREDFAQLSNWQHEGIGQLTQPAAGVMQLNCVGSRQGGPGCMAFCKQDFPDNILIEYDMKALTNRGLFITFIGFAARESGKDVLTDLPKREGIFADYIHSEALRCYHVSVSRCNDKGEHTGTSNWRRNPGIFMMAQQQDLCEKHNTWYHVAIVKQDKLLQMAVDGKLAGGFIDNDEIPEPIPTAGKVGFRSIGADVLVQIRGFKVTALE